MMNTVLGEGNYEIGCPHPEGEIGLTTVEELEELKDSVVGYHESDETEDEEPNDQNEVITRYVFTTGLVKYIVRVKHKLGQDYVTFSDYEVLNVTASANLMMLNSPLHSYEITSFSLQDFAVSRESYETTVTVYTNTVTKTTVAGSSTTYGGDQIFVLKMNATDGSKIGKGTMNGD
ncbi:hypothetical protein [Pontimicrobium sp. MEBiC06410]